MGDSRSPSDLGRQYCKEKAMNKIDPDDLRKFYSLLNGSGRTALTTVNPDKDGLQRLFARGDEWRDYLVTGIQRFTAKMPDYDLAKSILSSDFISPEEIATARGVTYTDEQLAKFGDTLPAKEMLEWCRDNGMMLVAGPPKAMSLLDIRAIKTDYFYSKEGGWYTENKQKLAQGDKAESIWIALRKEPVADSLGKNWSQQSELIALPKTVPNAAETVWGLTTYKAVRGIYLLPNLCVRTSSLGSDGRRVDVGSFDAGGLGIRSYWDGDRYDSLGLASARKF